MSERIFTEADQKAFAGLLPFAPGASLPFTPEAFESVEEALKPVFLIRPYSKKDREYLANHVRAGTYDKDSIATAMESGAISGWKNLFSMPDGVEVSFGPGILTAFPDKVFYQLHAKISELTYGPTKEEKEGLESPRLSTSEPLSKAA